MPDVPDKNYDAPVAAGAAAAAGTPFLGMIGQRELVNDPHVNKNISRVGLHELERMARPGDVILSSRPGWEGFKVTQAPFSGSEFFHATPVYGRRGGKGTVIDAGDLAEFADYDPKIKDVTREARTVRHHFPSHGYGDLTLVRPEKKLNPKDVRDLRRALTSKAYDPYSVNVGAKAALKDMFVPKVELPATLKKKMPPPTPKVQCKGTMCSALPAEAFSESGLLKQIAKGKKPEEILPADFLRSGSGFKPVASVLKQKRALSPISRALYRYGTRAGVGAGIGGTIYGAYKDPAATAGILGAAAAPLATRGLGSAIHRKLFKSTKDESLRAVGNQLPQAKRLLLEAFTPDPDMSPELMKKLKLRFGTRTLPLALAGGLGTYFAADKIRDWINKRKPTS